MGNSGAHGRNKKLAQGGGSWNTALKHYRLPGSQGDWHIPAGPSHRLLTAETGKVLSCLCPYSKVDITLPR